MKQFFCEDNGRLSMKRICGFICTIALCLALFKSQSDALVYSVAALGSACLGFTSAEKIFKPKNKE
jgi:hypothetical protein